MKKSKGDKLKNYKNIFITVVLLVVIAVLVSHIVSSQKNILGYMYNNAKREIRNLLGTEYSSETSETLENVKEKPDYNFFKEFNRNHLERAKDEESSDAELDRNLKALYKEAQQDKTNMFEYKRGTGRESIQAEVLKSYLVYNESELDIPDNIWVGLSKTKFFHDNDGKLFDGYAYLVVELKVTNTSSEDIGLINTSPGMEIFFLDKGELYYRSFVCLFHSFQPGDSEKNASNYYNFKTGDSFTSSYVFAVPVVAFDYFECCLAVCPPGNGVYPLKMAAMVIIDELRSQK